jgi:predicted ATP-binding protein involved in virulence
MPDYPPFSLNEMADGYSALVSIVAELIMRMDTGNAVVDYMRQGIVLIDEIETHLHIELQKKVLPFLTRMFPNVQFIVTTHSPFVVTSIEDAVIFDMEKRERLENLSTYSYETIIEAYFDTDMYSEKIRSLFERYQ